MHMTYYALPKPHPNSRYQAGALTLARAEILALLEKGGREGAVTEERVCGVSWLKIEAEALTGDQTTLLSRAAHLYMLFEKRDEGFFPVCGPREAYLGEDLPAALKYKGKTNEVFTAFMINMALCASGFGPEEALTVLDPMCGKGTTLFCAVNAGYDAVGVDVDAASVDEGLKYFARYLEYHRLKHEAGRVSLTAGRAQACVMHTVKFAADAERFRAKDTRTLKMACLPGEKLGLIYKKPMCHLIVCDLPYGVQHAPGAKKGAIPSIEDTLWEALPAWVDCLHTGGAIAISFNVNTLRPDMARGLLAEAGLDVMTGPSYDGLSHWVEQAITRDVAVAVRRF